MNIKRLEQLVKSNPDMNIIHEIVVEDLGKGSLMFISGGEIGTYQIRCLKSICERGIKSGLTRFTDADDCLWLNGLKKLYNENTKAVDDLANDYRYYRDAVEIAYKNAANQVYDLYLKAVKGKL